MIGYNVPTSVFGGTAPLVNESLVKWAGVNLMLAFHMMVALVIGMLALI